MSLLKYTDREIAQAISSYTYTYGAYMMILDELIGEMKLAKDAEEKTLLWKEIVECKNVLKSCTLVLDKVVGEC